MKGSSRTPFSAIVVPVGKTLRARLNAVLLRRMTNSRWSSNGALAIEKVRRSPHRSWNGEETSATSAY